MTETEKILYAKSFIDKLANGINPLDDSAIPEEDVVNNVRLSRCLFYVSDVLRRVAENGGTTGKPVKASKKPFFITPEETANFPFSDIPIPVSEIVRRINELTENGETRKKLTNRLLLEWLVGCSLLSIETGADGATRRVPTSEGTNLGLSLQKRNGTYGSYECVVYDINAQRFILDNLPDAFSTEQETNYQGSVWTQENDSVLKELFEKGVPAKEIAITLKRTETGVRVRLKRLGLIETRWDTK